MRTAEKENMRPAECLTGLDLEGGWHVDSIIRPAPKSTGGRFSVGYLVTKKDGRKAYLKALDFSSAFQHPDTPRALEEMTSAYNFERDLLAKCKDKKLDRVVIPLADGSAEAEGDFGLLRKVSYLIFELARGNIREEMAQWQDFDFAWALRSLHQTAVGLQQLHTTGIAHQDVKPSNILFFPVDGSKVSDLGRASYIRASSQSDQFQIPGDIGYAPPEQWYGWHHGSDFECRCVADLYLLGSLVFFYFLNCSVTQAIRVKISIKHEKSFNGTDFLHDLPYLQYAFNEAIDDLRESVEKFAEDLSDEIVLIALQLCEPDPRRRGDPRVLAAAHVPRYDLQPYISRFDRLASVAEKRMI
jgi:serine/threonine protein kinase